MENEKRKNRTGKIVLIFAVVFLLMVLGGVFNEKPSETAGGTYESETVTESSASEIASVEEDYPEMTDEAYADDRNNAVPVELSNYIGFPEEELIEKLNIEKKIGAFIQTMTI